MRASTFWQASQYAADIRSAMVSTFVTIFLAFLMGALAVWQNGSAAIFVVILGGLSMVAAVWVTLFATRRLEARGHGWIGPLASMSLRMTIPMICALLLVVFPPAGVPRAAVLYVVPLYMAMLASECIQMVRRLNVTGPIAVQGGGTHSGHSWKGLR